MDLTKLKSAEEVTPADFVKRLEDRAGKMARPAEHRVRDDGGVSLTKAALDATVSLRAPSAIAGGPPASVSPEDGKRMAEARGVSWDNAFLDRFVSYWMSDERVDSHGDIVVQTWDFDAFRKNAVMPFNHNWMGAPVGYIVQEGITQRKEKGYEGPALWGTGLFATRDMFEWADTVFRLVRAGFLRAGSVGFISHKVIDIKDEEERNKLGLGRFGFILDKNELLEFSPTLLGANKGAISVLAVAARKGLIEARDVDLIRELNRIENKHNPDTWRKDDSTLVNCARVLFAGSKYKHKEATDVEEPIVDLGAPEPQTDSSAVLAESLGAKMDDLANRLDASFSEIVQLMSDIRDHLEKTSTPTSDISEADTETPDIPRSLREGLARLDAGLARLTA